MADTSSTKTKASSARGGGKSRRLGWLRRKVGLDRQFALTLLVGFLALRIWDPVPVELVRLKLFDLYQQWQPRVVTQRPVTIIDLDEKSLQDVGQWPWPRTTVAQMVANAMQMGAVLVAFDVVFAEPDRMNPSAVADAIFGLDDETRKSLTGLPSNDAVFADVIRQSRVVIGQAVAQEGSGVERGAPPKKSAVAVMQLKGTTQTPEQWLPSFRNMIRNVPEIEQAATGQGIFTLYPEVDGIVRRVPLLFHHLGGDSTRLYPALSIEMLRVATGSTTNLVQVNNGGVARLRVGRGAFIPVDNKGQIWPYFSEHDKEKYVSARDVLAGTADPAKMQGRLTIVGTSATGLLDIRATPVEQYLPGVEVHAQIIESIFTNEYLNRPAEVLAYEVAFLLFGGLLMIWLVPKVGAKWTMLLFLCMVGGAAGTSWYLFSEQRVLLDAGFSVAAILLLYTLLTFTGYANEEAQRRQVRTAFGHYLSPAMVEKLAEDPDQLTLGGETRPMTMLFCDVRGFTTISETFKADPEGLTHLINKLLTPLTGIILGRQGTVDKYMGDCIMAFWNAPLDDPMHARNACISALEMNEAMDPLNERLEAEAKEEGRDFHPLRIGIGINSGDVVVGNMGSDQRFDYSVLGDAVNLAARLEGQCKTYVVDIVIGENTRAAVEDLAVLELDAIKVKGKLEAVHIFTVLGDDTVKSGNAFPVLEAAHDKMIAAYRGQRWDEAKAAIEECRSLLDGFNMAGFYDLYEERIAEYEADPPGDDWDGVYVATSK